MNYYNEIKNELINNEINRKVKSYSINRSDLDTYYKVGKLLSDAGKHYGKNVIGSYSKKLQTEVGKKYNERTLRRMRQLYLFFEKQKWSLSGTKLSLSHIRELFSLNDSNEIKYYKTVSEEQNLTRDELRSRIKSNEYERLAEETKNKLNKKKQTKVEYLVKNPIVIKNNNNCDIISEKILKKLILENIENFMKELGNSFSFVGSEYKIKLGNTYNYIDLLLFNYEYNCFVAIELKVTKLKKDHIGQIQVYMNYIDDNLRKINQDKTIGIIICKKDNKFIMEYCSDERILTREYELV